MSSPTEAQVARAYLLLDLTPHAADPKNADGWWREAINEFPYEHTPDEDLERATMALALLPNGRGTLGQWGTVVGNGYTQFAVKGSLAVRTLDGWSVELAPDSYLDMGTAHELLLLMAAADNLRRLEMGVKP